MSLHKKVLVLGSTGSIGTSTINIIRNHPDRFFLSGITSHQDLQGLTSLASEFHEVPTLLTSKFSQETLLDFIRNSDADIVVNGISGAAGLLPSAATLESGKDLALANKETIVMAGPLIRNLANANGKKILPVDSEHSAVFKLIEAFGSDQVSEIILTASGGPFRTLPSYLLKTVTLQDALKHPTWSMGTKISIDSASLANKGLEVIEACRLFDISPEKVKVTIHPQSLVHSFIRTVDGVLYAQISPPDMRHPIFDALTWPLCLPCEMEQLSFDQICTMQFEPPRHNDFPLLGLAYKAASLGGSYPIAFNAANEIAVEAFVQGKTGFLGLAKITEKVLEHNWTHEPVSFSEVLESDHEARRLAIIAIKEVTI